MRYVVEINARRSEVVDVPDGTTVRHGIMDVRTEAGLSSVTVLQFLLGEELLASFMGVMTFYRADLAPKKLDWVTGDTR